MRTEQEIRDYRNELYRFAVMQKQQGEMIADMTMIFVGELDWALGEREHDFVSMIALLEKRDKDSKKLALF